MGEHEPTTGTKTGLGFSDSLVCYGCTKFVSCHDWDGVFKLSDIVAVILIEQQMVANTIHLAKQSFNQAFIIISVLFHIFNLYNAGIVRQVYEKDRIENRAMAP